MKNTKKTIIALLLSGIIITSSGCEISPSAPTIGSDAQLSESSSSVSEESSESSIPETEFSEPEPEPEPVVLLSKREILRGSYFTVAVQNLDMSECVFTDFLGYERKFIEKDGIWYCFIPVKTAAEAGEYELSFTCGDFTCSETVTVTDRTFPTQYLTVAPSTLEETLEDEAVRAAFDAFFQEYRYNLTETALWNGEFVLPLGTYKYKETTAFGTFRTFSNGDTEWHNATDMAAPGGTPVYATNSGNILFAGWLGLTGNTIIIDHGCGVMSWHYHLSRLDVSAGEMVEKGKLIGAVGTTGLSTGNHLHFGLSVGGIFVDPMAMIGRKPEFEFWNLPEEEPEVIPEETTPAEPETSEEEEEEIVRVIVG